MIGKNALQKTGTKVVTNSNLAEFMKPGVNPISDMYYKGSNWFIKNPSAIPDFVEGYLPGIPGYSAYGYVGGVVGNIIYPYDEFYQDVKNLVNYFKDKND